MSTTATTTTSAQIFRHTAAFISETLSQSDLRHRLFSTFLQKIPLSNDTILKRLKLASQTLENALSTTNPAIRSSSLRLAEKILLSHSRIPFSSFLLSLVYSVSDRPVDASICLLDVFYDDPLLARLDIAPKLFEELFLIHFLPLINWYTEQKSRILASRNSGYNSDDQSVVVSNTSVLSKMSSDQASALRDLEVEYGKLLDENCRVFVGYFKEVLRDKSINRQSDPPLVVLEKSGRGHEVNNSEEEKIERQEFGSRERRYNPVWAEADRSVELDSNSAKRLSKFPSFYPERVSPNILTKQRSLKKSKTSPRHSASYSNPSDNYYSDSETEQEEKNEELRIMDSRKRQSWKQKHLISGEPIRSPDPVMEEIDKSPGRGKHTPPKDFICPITTHIFDDPVTLETGQTYERKAIQEWLDRGNSNCPNTRQKLKSTQLPKTNYVLKRLIASWQEENKVSTSNQSETSKQAKEQMLKPSNISASPNSVISQATFDGTMSELRTAITDLCTSEILKESEMAVLRIEKFWEETTMEMEIRLMISKPAVINGFIEILFNSTDTQVLRATVMLLSDLCSRDKTVIETLTRVDSDVECIISLFKNGLLEAVVLIHLLKPSALVLLEMDIMDSILMVMRNKEDDFPKLCVKPNTASVLLLSQIIQSADERDVSRICRIMMSTKGIQKIIHSLEAKGDEIFGAVRILLRCMLEDGKCRNIIAHKGKLIPVMDSLMGTNDVDRFEIVHFFYELVKLNRRNLNEQILHVLKDEGTFSTKHTLLTYLQTAPHDQSPVIAGLLLQLDLLEEPRKMSIYREEAIDALISCLRNTEFPDVQIAAAETVLSLQGRFSCSGKPLVKALLLKRAGLVRSYRSLMRKDQRENSTFDEDEEKVAEEWERKVAFVLVSHEFGLLFEVLAEGLKSRHTELSSPCYITATWLVHMLNVLPDTGIRGAACVCLLKHFVYVFKSEKTAEDRALSMLALRSFIHDPG